MANVVESRDIHDLPVSEWGQIVPELVGGVVEVRIICVHAFGVGVELTAQGAYGHVNPPHIPDDRFTVEEMSHHVGEVRRALVLAADLGRQPRLTLRPSEIPTADRCAQPFPSAGTPVWQTSSMSESQRHTV